MALCLKTSLLIMGLSGIIAQIILLRELLVSFQGNELTLGIILANWLVLEAFGSFFIGKTVERTLRKMETFVLLQLIFSLAFPLVLYLSRILKNILLTTPGEALGLGPIFTSSFLILLPVAIPHGALFTYGSKLYAQSFREEAASIGKVYVLETIGTILGGLGITYLLIPYLNSFEIAFLLSLINSLVSAFLLWPGRQFLTVHVQDNPARVFLSTFPPLCDCARFPHCRTDSQFLDPISVEEDGGHPQRKLHLRQYHSYKEGRTIYLLHEWSPRPHGPGSGYRLHRRPDPFPHASP